MTEAHPLSSIQVRELPRETQIILIPGKFPVIGRENCRRLERMERVRRGAGWTRKANYHIEKREER